jgi:hypothetical protein
MTARWRDRYTTSRYRVTATLARRPGATEARVEGALTYGQRDPKMKVAVKESSTQEEDVTVPTEEAGEARHRGAASRRLGNPRAASSFRGGGVDTAPSVDSSFSSSSPLLLLLLRCAVVWMGMKPRGG